MALLLPYPKTLPSRTFAPRSPSHAVQGHGRAACIPAGGSAPWHPSLLNCSHAGTACRAPPNGKGHRQVLLAGRAEAAWLAGCRGGWQGCSKAWGAAHSHSGQRGTGPGFSRGWWKGLILCRSWRRGERPQPGSRCAGKDAPCMGVCRKASLAGSRRLCAEADVTSAVSYGVLQLNDRISPLGNSCLRHPCSKWPNALVATETLGLKQREPLARKPGAVKAVPSLVHVDGVSLSDTFAMTWHMPQCCGGDAGSHQPLPSSAWSFGWRWRLLALRGFGLAPFLPWLPRARRVLRHVAACR